MLYRTDFTGGLLLTFLSEDFPVHLCFFFYFFSLFIVFKTVMFVSVFLKQNKAVTKIFYV